MDARRDLLLVLGAALGVMVLLAALPTPEPPSRGAPTFAITDTLIFDGERFHEAVDLWIQDGRIHALGPDLALPEDLERVDGSGRTVLPGLIDAHTHVFGEALRQALDFGVTTEVDMFSPPEQVRAARLTRDGLANRDEADLFSAGVLVTAPGGHGTEYGLSIPTLSSPEAAEDFVAERLAEGSDFIKVVLDDGRTYGIDWPTLDDETLSAVVAAGRSRGVKVVVHVSTLDAARRALRAGADGLVHLFADRPVDTAFVDLARETGAFVIATLSVLESLSGESVPGWQDDPRVGRWLDVSQRQSLAGRFDIPEAPEGPLAAANLKALHQAGVPILAGTDAPNPGTAHGVSLHHELALMAAAGMPVDAVLRSATSLPARLFPLGDRGRIEAGFRADLLLVEGDIRDDIGHSLDILRIWKNGHPVNRRAAVLGRDAHPAGTLARGSISRFETDLSARIGSDWQASTDRIRGGQSSARLSRDEAGHDSPGALAVTGEVRPGFAWPWAGAVWFPSEVPMQGVRFEPDQTLVFAARGDGRPYTVLFLTDTGALPVRYPFEAGANWTEVRIRLSDLPGLRGTVLTGVVFAAGPEPGRFGFQLDEVSIR